MPKQSGDTWVDATGLDITEDLDEGSLAQLSFMQEIVVYWHEDGDRYYGIIVGYSDPDGDHTFAKTVEVDLGQVGMFTIDPVKRMPDGRWEEVRGAHPHELKRTQFVVFGPADRDPGDRELAQARKRSRESNEGPLTARVQEQLINVGSWSEFAPFLAALTELAAMKATLADPAFNVRLDVNHKVSDETGHYERKCRILVRPVEQPLMHEEIQAVLRVAERYELACSTSSNGAGIEIHRPEDV